MQRYVSKDNIKDIKMNDLWKEKEETPMFSEKYNDNEILMNFIIIFYRVIRRESYQLKYDTFLRFANIFT